MQGGKYIASPIHSGTHHQHGVLLACKHSPAPLVTHEQTYNNYLLNKMKNYTIIVGAIIHYNYFLFTYINMDS